MMNSSMNLPARLGIICKRVTICCIIISMWFDESLSTRVVSGPTRADNGSYGSWVRLSDPLSATGRPSNNITDSSPSILAIDPYIISDSWHY